MTFRDVLAQLDRARCYRIPYGGVEYTPRQMLDGMLDTGEKHSLLEYEAELNVSPASVMQSGDKAGNICVFFFDNSNMLHDPLMSRPDLAFLAGHFFLDIRYRP